MNRMNRRGYLVALALAAGWSVHTEAQSTFRLAEQRTAQGLIEISSANDTNLVFVSIDVTNDGKHDGNIEAMYTIELKSGVEKPRAAKVLGTIEFKNHESLVIKAGTVQLVFSRVLADTAKSPGQKAIVDLIEGRRSQRAVGIQTHADLVRELSKWKQLPRRPPGV